MTRTSIVGRKRDRSAWPNAGIAVLGLGMFAGYVLLVLFGGAALWRTLVPDDEGVGRAIAAISGFLLPISVPTVLVLAAHGVDVRARRHRSRVAASVHMAIVGCLAVAAFLNSLLFFFTIGRGRSWDANYRWFVETYPGANRWAIVALVVGLVLMLPVAFVLARLLPSADRGDAATTGTGDGRPVDPD